MRVISERWTKLVREVAIIVLGVVIALILGEIATAIRDRVEAHRAMRAVEQDMIDNATQFDLMPLIMDCNMRRLKTLAGILAEARRTELLPDIGDIPARPGSTFRTGAWERAVANGNVLFVDQSRVAELADYHDLLRVYRSNLDEMALDWARLGMLAHAAGPIDDNTLATARQTVAELRYHSDVVRQAGALLMQTHKRLGLPLIYDRFNGVPTSRSEHIRRIRNGPTCATLKVDHRQNVARAPTN